MDGHIGASQMLRLKTSSLQTRMDENPPVEEVAKDTYLSARRFKSYGLKI